MNKLLKVFFSAALIFLSTFAVNAQKLKSPSDFLGYQLGAKFSYHSRVVDYFEYIADGSDKVLLQKYGTSNEGRTLEVAYISAPKNLDRIDEIQKANLIRAGFLDGDSGSEDIAIVWMSYNVHGNEANSTETAMQVLYDLANGTEGKYEKWLENLVIIIDPCLNPDGRDRYVNWYNQVVGKTPNVNINTREHHEGWAQGRSNHYLFDLNRDWVWQTQVESQARLKFYNSWLPHVHVDFHEQSYNSQYYFAPAAQPMHELITPWQREFQEIAGKNNGKYFDEKGWLYFTKEVFDLLYPGYGDSYPIFSGAIGMTYEMPGHSTAGLAIETPKGDTLTLSKRIEMHFTTSMATIEACYANQEKLVSEFENFYHGKKDLDTYYLLKSSRPDRIELLTALLDKNLIQYTSPGNTKTMSGFSYEADGTVNVRIEPADLLVPMNQPKSTLVKVLFEKSTHLVDSLTYDITAWSLPYMYGLDAYIIKGKIDTQKYTYSHGNTTKAAKNPYAYLLNWTSTTDAKFLSNILDAGFRLQYSSLPFRYSGLDFSAGTLIITKIDNEKRFSNYEEALLKIATPFKRNLIPVYSGMAIPSLDLGSEKIHFLKKPKIALLAGGGISTLNFGELWHFFDQELGYPIDILDKKSSKNMDLDDYDALILASGHYPEFDDTEGFKKIDDWVQEGGNLILIEDAISEFIGKDKFALENDSDVDSVEKESVLYPYELRERENLRQNILGGIIKVELDNTHPLAYGFDKNYYTLKNNSASYSFLADGWNVGYITSQKQMVSGFVGVDFKDKLDKNLVFGVESRGKGNVIYFVDNPVFRGFWQNGKLFLANAVFFNN